MYTTHIVDMLNGGLTFRLVFLVVSRPGLAIPLSNSGSREPQGLGCKRYHTRRPEIHGNRNHLGLRSNEKILKG